MICRDDEGRQDLFRRSTTTRSCAALYGELLAEVQRITSEGDYEAGQGPGRDLRRPGRSGAPRGGPRALRQAEPGALRRLRQPGLHAGRRERQDRRRQDLLPEGYVEQMLRYGKDYSFLQ